MARRCAQCEKMIHAADFVYCEGAYVHDRCANSYREALATSRKRRAAPPDPETVAKGTGIARGGTFTAVVPQTVIGPDSPLWPRTPQARPPRYRWNECYREVVQPWLGKNKGDLHGYGKLAELEGLMTDWFPEDKCPGKSTIREYANRYIKEFEAS